MIIILGALATYYAALSISREDGPFAVFCGCAISSRLIRGWRAVSAALCACRAIRGAGGMRAVGGRHMRAIDAPVVARLAGASVVIDRYWKR